MCLFFKCHMLGPGLAWHWAVPPGGLSIAHCHPCACGSAHGPNELGTSTTLEARVWTSLESEVWSLKSVTWSPALLSCRYLKCGVIIRNLLDAANEDLATIPVCRYRSFLRFYLKLMFELGALSDLWFAWTLAMASKSDHHDVCYSA